MNNIQSISFGLVFFIWCMCRPLLFSQPTLVDRIVAVVGREYILASDLDAQVEFYVFNNHLDPDTPGLKEKVLDAMVNEKLILAKALEDTTISVTDDEVSNQLDGLITQRIQQVGSQQRLEEIYGMPISWMKREFRDEMRKQLLVQRLQQVKFGDVPATLREIEEFFQAYKDSLPKVPEELELYHIFKVPKVGEAAKKRVRAKAEALLDSIQGGGDFTDFARRYSEDPGSAPAGGDLGLTRRGQFVKEFEEVVFSLKENELRVTESPFGFHIVQLLERRGESVHARHILFKIERDSSETDATVAYLRSLKDSVAHGVDFSELARRYSDDKESAPLGGSLGKYTADQFDKALLETVKDLKEEEISDPVSVDYGTSRGYHIVYLKERIPEHAMNLTDDWKRIEQLATANKRNGEYQKWLTRLRSEIYWELRL